MSLQLYLAQKQKLGMTMQLQQMITLLQLPSTDLLKMLNEMVENCVFLELETYDSHSSYGTYQNKPFSSETAYSDHDDDMDAYTVPVTLRQQLSWQADLLSLSHIERLIAEVLIDSINDKGYLEITPEEVLSVINIEKLSVSDVLSVLKKIQNFEPTGIAARTQQECLRLQIKQYKGITAQAKNNALYLLDEQNYQSLACNDINLLQKKTQLSTTAIYSALQLIRNLTLNPGRIADNNNASFCVPDLIISKKEKLWTIRLNKAVSPKLTINRHYVDSIKAAPATIAKTDLMYWKHQLQNAKSFVRGLNKRYSTLMRIAQILVTRQKDFLEKGDLYLHSLSMQEVALEMGVHESTVYRAVQHKYIQIPQRVLPMNYFFSSQTCKEGLSSVALQAYIKQFISGENTSKPLTDTDLQKQLKHAGFDISRRTITKYREKMGFVSAKERKRWIKNYLLSSQ